MTDEIFLKSLQFDIDGYINFNTKTNPEGTDTLNLSQRIIDYNISPNSFDKNEIGRAHV